MDEQYQKIEKFLLNKNYEKAISLATELLENQPKEIDNYLYLGLAHLLNKNEDEAESVWLSMFFDVFDENITEKVIYFLDQQISKQLRKNQIDNAVLIYQKIKEIEPDYLSFSLSINQYINDLIKQGINSLNESDFLVAKNCYNMLVTFEPEKGFFWKNLALTYYELFEYQQAYQSILKAIEVEPNQDNYYYHAGLILEKLKLEKEAINIYQQAINLNNKNVDAYNNLGNLLVKNNQIKEAEYIYEKAINSNPSHFGSYLNVGNLLMSKDEVEKAIIYYEKAIKLNKDSDIYFWIVNNIRSFNNIQKAVDFAKNNASLFPENLLVELETYRILPFLYEQESQINHYRQNLKYFLNQISNNLDIKSNQKEALELINRHSNYHLHYQALNDLEWQTEYGKFVHKVMQCTYPQWCEEIPQKNNPSKSKIKVGYISGCFKNHVVGRLSLGWIKHHNPNQFEIYCYYLGDYAEDNLTQEFKQYSDKFQRFSNAIDLNNVAEKIRKDELDILVFLELAISPKTAKLAALKLAPIQCVTWMHPITSGIPTIDYFISSQLMEGKNATKHYSEKLIKLSNLSVCISKMERNLLDIHPDKNKFHLKQDKIIYVSSQFCSKYLPQYDYLYPRIAEKVDNAKFVFVHPQDNPRVNQQLWNRIRKSFAEYNLDSEKFCVFLPRINNSSDYWQFLKSCDIFLDTIGFTGFNSTLDALECFLPVVTYSGEYFRTRQSEGILKMIQVTDTVAKSEEDYINIAIQLGLNKQWRENIVTDIKQNLNLLYEDITPLQDLEAFYRQVTNNC